MTNCRVHHTYINVNPPLTELFSQLAPQKPATPFQIHRVPLEVQNKSGKRKPPSVAPKPQRCDRRRSCQVRGIWQQADICQNMVTRTRQGPGRVAGRDPATLTRLPVAIVAVLVMLYRVDSHAAGALVAVASAGGAHCEFGFAVPAAVDVYDLVAHVWKRDSGVM